MPRSRALIWEGKILRVLHLNYRKVRRLCFEFLLTNQLSRFLPMTGKLLQEAFIQGWEAQGIKLFAKGGTVKIPSVKAWEMMPSNPY